MIVIDYIAKMKQSINDKVNRNFVRYTPYKQKKEQNISTNSNNLMRNGPVVR